MKRLSNPWEDIEGYFCFGCSPANTAGLHLHFYGDADEVVSVLSLNRFQQGWIDTLHGGLIATALDEIACWAIIARTQTSGVTSKIEIRYFAPVKTTWQYCIVKAKVVKEMRKIVVVQASIYSPDNELCAQAECTYFCYTHKQAEELQFKPCVPFGDDMTLDEIIERELKRESHKQTN